MATILELGAFREELKPPSHWVDASARAQRSPALRGWLRDLAGLAEVLFADEVGPPDRARIRWVCLQTQEYAAAVGPKAELAFRLSLLATNWISPMMIGKLPPLRRLRYSDRLRALKRYEGSSLGLSLYAVKAFVGSAWFEHPDVASEVNFDGRAKGRRR